MLNLGVIGAGIIYRAYERAVDLLPGVVIRAVADSDPKQLSCAAREGRDLFTNVDDLLKLPLDAVLVLTPNASHAPIAGRCLERGFPTLCEKPLATTVDDAEKLQALSRATGTFLSVAMHCRHWPEVRYLRDNVRGRVTSFSQAYCENWTQAPGWYFDPRQSGGGVLLDVGVNQIDWLFPHVESLQINSVGMDMGNARVELDCLIDWRFQGGAGRTTLSWRATIERKKTVVRTDSDDEFELDHKDHSVVHNGAPKGPWACEEYTDVLRDFLDRRRGGVAAGPPDPSKLLRILSNVYREAGLTFLS